ncbi:MAG TPA: aspartate--tRNA ligase [Candidatus Acetothermia bacterium]|nr:aspartate--tRNA ligase [Candidatus Acetothermia bacterium]
MRRDGCGELRREAAGRKVVLAGWVHRVRNLGGVTFVDLRDASGIVQLVLRNGAHLAHEDVVRVTGTVCPREAPNPSLPTGEIEIEVAEIEVLSRAKPLPLPVADEGSPSEETRLRYRYLDLRKPRLQRNLRLRHRAALAIRNYLDKQGFVEVETPLLTRSTPEGARDFLVPSRLARGSFYALPQSPQLFKQILVTSGVERYFQIVRCFRDEDLRADRQPEFTQLDLEMAFLEDPEELFPLLEGLVAHVFREAIGIEIDLPLPRLPYAEALARYGSDKPDLRFGMEIVDVIDLFPKQSVLAVLQDKIGVARALPVPGGAAKSRSQLAKLAEAAEGQGLDLLAWVKLSEGISSSLGKHVSAEILTAIAARAGAEQGDLVLVAVGEGGVVETALGDLRLRLARDLGLIPRDRWSLVWVVDFPLFKEGEGHLDSEHHPFTSPRSEDLPLLERDPLKVRAKCYDLVVNGVELASGSIRIHRRELQERIFRILGIGGEEAEQRFGFFLRALDYGAPPHGGIAFGLDRWVMMMAGEPSIREVIAFPKTTTGACPLTDAPAPVDEGQLRELGLRLEP